MKSICETASKKYPGLYSVCSTVADGMSSITTKLDKQIDEALENDNFELVEELQQRQADLREELDEYA